MSILLAAALAVCPAPKIVKPSDEWTHRDQLALDRALVGCKEHYSPDHCLKTFTKVVEGTYRVICKKY